MMPAPDKPAHVVRMEEESSQVGERLSKLHSFMDESPIFAALDQQDRALLVAQAAAMYAYSSILTLRLMRAAG